MTVLQNENTLSYEETYKILENFFEDCERFWKNEKQNYPQNYKEEIDVKQNTLRDVLNLKNNPYSPKGKSLNPIAKADFLKKNNMDAPTKG